MHPTHRRLRIVIPLTFCAVVLGCPTERSVRRDLSAKTVTIRADRVGYRPESISTQLERGRGGKVAIALHRSASSCCRLNGAWNVRFELEKSSDLQRSPTRRLVDGLVVFSERLPNPRRNYELRDSI